MKNLLENVKPQSKKAFKCNFSLLKIKEQVK